MLQSENTVRLEAAQADHQAMCERLAVEHEEAKVNAQREFEELRAFLTKHNEQLTNEARASYQEALQQAQVGLRSLLQRGTTRAGATRSRPCPFLALCRSFQADYDQLCINLREAHEKEQLRVKQRNAEILPQVQVARLATAELGRVQAFAEHIRMCANKVGLGVNFMPNTPCYDRVVEMQALNEALLKAFPDVASDDYPWPDYEIKGKQGTGWVAAPEPKSLVLPNPAAEIARMALGKKPLSPGRRSESPSMSPRSASPEPRQTSWQQSRPASAAPAIGAAGKAERISSSGRTRFSNLMETSPSPRAASLSASLSSRRKSPATAWAGFSADQSPLSKAAAGGNKALQHQQPSRPQSALTRSASSSVFNRPVSASKYLPARVSAKLGGIQSTLAATTAVRTSAGARNQAAAGGLCRRPAPPSVHRDRRAGPGVMRLAEGLRRI